MSRRYEVLAFDEISKIESNQLLYVLLNIPLTQHDGKSLFSLALKQKRVEFLNNDRINSLIVNMYHERKLSPEDTIEGEDFTYCDMLKLIVTQPFKFYFTTQGMIHFDLL